MGQAGPARPRPAKTPGGAGRGVKGLTRPSRPLGRCLGPGRRRRRRSPGQAGLGSSPPAPAAPPPRPALPGAPLSARSAKRPRACAVRVRGRDGRLLVFTTIFILPGETDGSDLSLRASALPSCTGPRRPAAWGCCRRQVGVVAASRGAVGVARGGPRVGGEPLPPRADAVQSCGWRTLFKIEQLTSSLCYPIPLLLLRQPAPPRRGGPARRCLTPAAREGRERHRQHPASASVRLCLWRRQCPIDVEVNLFATRRPGRSLPAACPRRGSERRDLLRA